MSLRQKIVKVVNQIAHWPNRLDIRDYESIYNIPYPLSGVDAFFPATITVAAGATSQDVIKNPLFFNQEQIGKIGWYDYVRYKFYADDGNVSILYGNGKTITYGRFNVTTLPGVEYTVPVKSPNFYFAIHNSDSTSHYCYFEIMLQVIMADKFNPRIEGQNRPYETPIGTTLPKSNKA